MLTTTGGMRGDSLEECKRVGDSWEFALAGGESEILRSSQEIGDSRGSQESRSLLERFFGVRWRSSLEFAGEILRSSLEKFFGVRRRNSSEFAGEILRSSPLRSSYAQLQLRPFFYSTHWCFAVQDVNARDSYIYKCASLVGTVWSWACAENVC